jgi:hypothetical protein
LSSPVQQLLVSKDEEEDDNTTPLGGKTMGGDDPEFTERELDESTSSEVVSEPVSDCISGEEIDDVESGEDLLRTRLKWRPSRRGDFG